MRRSASAVIGVDPSTTSTAGLIVPINWDGDWNLPRIELFGEPGVRSRDDYERALANEKLGRNLARFATDYGCRTAWIESYGFRQNKNAHTLGELGQAVRIELIHAGVHPRSVWMSSARKLLLGNVPGGGKAKRLVLETLLVAGMPRWPGLTLKELEDVADAFVCANFALAELGGFCFAQLGGANGKDRR